MRRLLSDTWAYLASLIRIIHSSWDRFFFTPSDPTPLGLVRVGTGALALWSLWVYGLDLHAYLGSGGWADPEFVRSFMTEENPTAWSFWLMVPDSMLRVVWLGCILVLTLFTLGLWSRVTAILAWMIFVSTVRRSPVTVYGFDQMMSTWLLYLAITGASGQAVSLERYFSRYKRNRAEIARRSLSGLWTAPSGIPEPSISANLSLRLIQLHLVVIYGMAALAKFHATSWWTGDAFWGILASGEFRLFDLTWLANYPRFINALTHIGLALEIAYPILVWVKPIRPLMMAAILVMHIGIGLTLGLTEFSLAMVVGNMAFLSGVWIRSLAAGDESGKASAKVLYDGACPRCRAVMALITAGDPDRVIEPIDLTTVDVSRVHSSLTKDQCLASMHLVRSTGKVEKGYDAIMTILACTPLFWPMSLVRYVPGVSWVGRRVYNHIADSRPRDAVCNDEVCGLHPSPTVPSQRSPR